MDRDLLIEDLIDDGKGQDEPYEIGFDQVYVEGVMLYSRLIDEFTQDDKDVPVFIAGYTY